MVILIRVIWAEPKNNQVDISDGFFANHFFCINTYQVVGRLEWYILTITMLTPTGWVGLGYGFGVEQFREYPVNEQTESETL